MSSNNKDLFSWWHRSASQFNEDLIHIVKEEDFIKELSNDQILVMLNLIKEIEKNSSIIRGDLWKKVGLDQH